MKFSISETGRNYNSLFKLADNNWVIIMEQKRRSTDGHVLFEPVEVSGGVQASNCDSYDEYVKTKKKKTSPYICLIRSRCRIESFFFSWSNLWMSNRFQHFKEAGMKKRNIYLRSKQFSIIYPHSYNTVNILLYKYIYVDASVSNMRLNSNVKARLKKVRCFFFLSVYCLFPVNTEYVIKHQL